MSSYFKSMCNNLITKGLALAGTSFDEFLDRDFHWKLERHISTLLDMGPNIVYVYLTPLAVIWVFDQTSFISGTNWSIEMKLGKMFTQIKTNYKNQQFLNLKSIKMVAFLALQ